MALKTSFTSEFQFRIEIHKFSCKLDYVHVLLFFQLEIYFKKSNHSLKIQY